jgi:hypothetical protein
MGQPTADLVRPLKTPRYRGRRDRLSPLVDKKELLKSAAGYRLEHAVRTEFDALYGQPATTVAITSLLAGLPAKLPTLAERTSLTA